MTTELTEIKKYTRIYNNPPNEQAFTIANNYLLEVYKKWGTCNVSTIQNLIK